jgi:hypothetical protein
MPRPAPVTTMTFPSSDLPAMAVFAPFLDVAFDFAIRHARGVESSGFWRGDGALRNSRAVYNYSLTSATCRHLTTMLRRTI